MKKLMSLCFVILFSALAILSFINYSYDGVDRVEQNKQRITIDKPESVTNEQFINEISSATAAIGADIMYRYVDMSGDKAHYLYYRTNHTTDFVSTGNRNDNKLLGATQCISTTEPEGYTVYRLKAASTFQDISFFSLEKAAAYDLSSCAYYVASDSVQAVVTAVTALGYTATPRSEATVTGKMSIVLFAFIPICLMVMSMAFYVLSNGKKNVLKKMEGYRSTDILLDEIRAAGKTFAIALLAIEAFNLGAAAIAFTSSILQYIAFTAQYILIGGTTIAVGTVVALVIICTQRGSSHVKGKAPKRAMYYTTMAGKCVFVVFIMFFMSIAIRNVQVAYNTYATSQFIAEKVADYVTIPVYDNNAALGGLEENYLAFYRATVDEYNGVLVSASNYTVDLSSGKTLFEEFGQEEIIVNKNYFQLNPIYDPAGNAIDPSGFAAGAITVLVPEAKTDRIEKYTGFVKTAYEKEASFVLYDGANSDVYSYNAEIGSGYYGAIDQPIIIVVGADDLDGSFVLSYCSYGAYFIKPHTSDPYAELLPVLRETGLQAVTLQLPSILANFNEVLNHQYQMLLIYGTQTLVLSIGLACLILFSGKLYCENDRKKIAFSLVEGFSLFSCIWKHLIVTVIVYALALIAALFVETSMQVSLNYFLLLGAFLIEIVSALLICSKFTRVNLYAVLKGAE